MDQDARKLIEEAPEPARRQFMKVIAMQEADRFEAAMRQVRRAATKPEQMDALQKRVMEMAQVPPSPPSKRPLGR